MDAKTKLELTELLAEADRRRARTDPVFFINNYLKTYDPRPEAAPHHLDFKLYPFQEDYVRDTINAIRTGHDIFDEKSRDMGASWLALACRFYLWCFEPSYQSLIGSRKEEYVDDGTLKSLFPKLDYFIDHIKDKALLPKDIQRTYMKLINKDTGNTITGESSNKNFSRGGRFDDVLFDELGFWPDARASWSAAGDATRCRHAVTTPPDEPSFAKTLRNSDKVKVRTWHWTLHPEKDQAWYDYEKSRRSEEEVLHELDISWEYSSLNRPYPEINHVIVGKHEYDPELPLYMSIDLGLDAVAIGYYQPVRNSDLIIMIDAYENQGKIIDWYMPLFGKPISSEYIYNEDDLEMIRRVSVWRPAIVFGDPSGKSSHIESDVSPYEIMRRKYNIVVQTNDKENNWPPRRDAAKRVLGRLRINDTPRTKWFIDCVSSARYPKRDEETSQSVTPISKPVHDWTSHHRTQLEFFAVNYNAQHNDDPSSYVSSPSAHTQSRPMAISGLELSPGLESILGRGDDNSNGWML